MKDEDVHSRLTVEAKRTVPSAFAKPHAFNDAAGDDALGVVWSRDAGYLAYPPLQQRAWRIRIGAMFEHAFDIRSDHDRLHRIAQQVAYHAHAAGMRYLHEHGEVRTMLPERRMGGMPDALPTEDPTTRFDLGPMRIKRVTAVTKPLGPELPSVTMAAALHHEPVLA